MTLMEVEVIFIRRTTISMVLILSLEHLRRVDLLHWSEFYYWLGWMDSFGYVLIMKETKSSNYLLLKDFESEKLVITIQ